MNLGRSALLALAVFVLANVATYVAQERGVVSPAVPRAMIENHIGTLTEADLWLIGNSTMEAGVETGGRSGVAKVPMGSATLRAQVALAEAALAEPDARPREVVVFVTKDDLNANGERAVTSAHYLGALGDPSLFDRIAARVPLYACRSSIRGKTLKAITQLMNVSRPGGNESKAEERPRERVYRDFSSQLETTYMANLGRDYAPDIPDLGPLAEAAQTRGAQLTVVLPPAADVVATWQDRFAPEHPWPAVRDSLRAETERAGGRLLDFTDALPSTTEYFRDPYHVNRRGRAAFTAALFDSLSGGPVPEPTTE